MVDVLLISGSFYPREGGAERQLRTVLSELRELGLSVCVVTQVIPERVDLPKRVQNIPVARVGSARLFSNLPRVAQLQFISAAIFAAVVRRPRAVISLQMGTASIAASITARALKIPHVLRLTGGGTPEHVSEPYSRAASWYGRAWAKLFSRPQTTVIAPANHLLRDYQTNFPHHQSRTVKVPNGVTPFTVAPEKLCDVVWYSRTSAASSTDDLIEIARRVPEARFCVIGNRVDEALPNIQYLGWQTEPEPVIGRHRVLLNTSPTEGMPNTALQALAWNTRVVGYSNAGMRELMDEFPDAISLADPHDFDRTSELVRLALASPPMSKVRVQTDSDVLAVWKRLIMTANFGVEIDPPRT